MKQTSTLSLKIVLRLIAVGMLAALIRFPQTEGRAADLDLFSIYSDPVIIYMYIASIPFFAAVFQAFKLLGFVEKNKIFSAPAVTAAKNIKYYALTIVGFILGAEAYLFLVLRNSSEDSTGAVMMGAIIAFISISVATGAAVLQKYLQNA